MEKNKQEKKLFGTDGIRGVYRKDTASKGWMDRGVISDETAYRLGNVLGRNNGKIIVGRDTRPSGPALLKALIAGVHSAGGRVKDMGIIGTPAVSFALRHDIADWGVVISASHNPAEYNGLKVFKSSGVKPSDEDEIELEEMMSAPMVKVSAVDKNTRVPRSGGFFLQYITRLSYMLNCKRLEGMKIVLDCSNGALSHYAGDVFSDLGAEVFLYNTAEEGGDINKDCGATNPLFIMQKVVDKGADMGFAFDGDGDRVIASDERGCLVDGDQILYAVASFWSGRERTGMKLERMLERAEEKASKRLFVPDVVGTLHTNMGAEKAIRALGIPFHRTDIGDHYVTERMLQLGARIGGEQSGHIILGDYGPTGDGLAAGIFLAKICALQNKKLSELTDIKKFPQCNLNLVTDKKEELLADSEVAEFLKKEEEEIAGSGRILVRASGTEPKIRVMAECEEEELSKSTARKIYEFLQVKSER
jgi:phosphoglucosamine mutase